MNKMFQLSRSAIVLALIGLTGCLSTDPNPGNSAARTRMSEETAAFIRDRKIPLKGADAEFYGNQQDQVYLLSSQERVKLNAKASAKNTVAVINYKRANGKSSFYLIEQKVTPKQITFVLRKDSKVLESLPIRVAAAPHPGGGGNCQSFCDQMEASNKAILQKLKVEADKTCSRRFICLPICGCSGGFGIETGAALYDIQPDSRHCQSPEPSKYRLFWSVRNPSPFLDQAFDVAIKKEAKLYTY